MYFDELAATSLTIGPREYAVKMKTTAAAPTRHLGNLFILRSSSIFD
jgi:hypothetical protein